MNSDILIGYDTSPQRILVEHYQQKWSKEWQDFGSGKQNLAGTTTNTNINNEVK